MEDLVRVLVVDDDPEVADGLGELLTEYGCEVRVAHDGNEALDAVEAFDPHCVLLDLRMPHPDGIETARAMRERYKDNVVLVAITGSEDASVGLRPDLSMMDHCLRKPIDLAALRRIIPLSD